MNLFIAPDGTVRAVACDDLRPIMAELGDVRERRASHVWPVHEDTQLAFRALRFLFGERGRIADWCRTWSGPWGIYWPENPKACVFWSMSRQECLEWEHARLEEKLAQ